MQVLLHELHLKVIPPNCLIDICIQAETNPQWGRAAERHVASTSNVGFVLLAWDLHHPRGQLHRVV